MHISPRCVDFPFGGYFHQIRTGDNVKNIVMQGEMLPQNSQMDIVIDQWHRP